MAGLLGETFCRLSSAREATVQPYHAKADQIARYAPWLP